MNKIKSLIPKYNFHEYKPPILSDEYQKLYDKITVENNNEIFIKMIKEYLINFHN